MRLRRAIALTAGAACIALTAGALMAGSALAAVHPDGAQQTMISLTLPAPEVIFGVQPPG